MPSDFKLLATFLYGAAYRGPLGADAGMRSHNLKRLETGRRPVPPPLAEFLLRRVADRWLLRGWADQAPPAGLSPEIAAELERRIAAMKEAGDGQQDP